MPFTPEQIDTFMMEIDPDNLDKYILVRKVVFLIGLSGGLRGHDLRPLTQNSLKEVTGGLQVTFPPCKTLRGHVKTHR